MVLENKIEERLREIRSLINHNDDYNDNANVEKNKKTKNKKNKSKNKQLVLWEKQQLCTCFLVHFFDVHCTTTTWNLLMQRFMEDVNSRRRNFSLSF